jgi:hypothetical protein
MKILSPRDHFGGRCTTIARAWSSGTGIKRKAPERVHGPGGESRQRHARMRGRETWATIPGGHARTTGRCQARLTDNDGMIRDITISAKGTGDDQYYEPPARVLSLAVIGGDAHLAIYEHGNVERAAGPAVTVQVPARSLLLALTAAIDDDQRTANGDSIRG